MRLCIDQVIKHWGFLLFIIGGRTDGATVTTNYFTWVFKGRAKGVPETWREGFRTQNTWAGKRTGTPLSGQVL